MRKYVIYDRSRPCIRAVLLLGDVLRFGSEEGQPIVSRRLEWDRDLTKAEMRKALGLLDEVAMIERRGRPRGCSHPKRKPPSLDASAPATKLSNILERHLTREQVKTVFLYLKLGNQAKVAQQLGITPQAVNKRLNAVGGKLSKINPIPSLRNILGVREPLGSGQRWNGRPFEVDDSGISYVRDIGQDLERRRKF